jgi:hypothetical protein
METQLSRIMPTQGVYFVAAKEPTRFPHFTCNTVDEIVQKVGDIDAQGLDAFIACASFKQKSYIDVNKKRRQRTAENVGWVKSFWLDIDCNPDKASAGIGYLDIQAAITALDFFIKITELPKPLVVHSGGGLHIYWPLQTDISPEQWLETAEKIKALSLARTTRLIADQSRTTDLASILRPVGSHNWKDEYDKPKVVLLEQGEVTDFADFKNAVDTAHIKFCSEPIQRSNNTELNTALAIEGYEIPGRVEEGSRNPGLLAYMAHLRGIGAFEDDVVEKVREFNKTKCKPPLDDDEVEKILERYPEQANIRPTELTTDEWPEPQAIKSALSAVPEFDIDLLPDAFKPLVADASELMQAPPDFIAVPLMVAAAATLGNGWAIAPKARDLSWKVPPVLWGAIIGRPGTKKSPCMDKALVPLMEIEKQLANDHVSKLQKYQTDKVIYEAAVKNAKVMAAKTGLAPQLPTEPEEPQPERLVVNDSTYQKLGEILHWSPRGVAVVMDELVGLLEALDVKGQEGARAFYLAAWNGDQSHRIDRIGRGSNIIERLSVSVLGGMQPGKLQNYIRQATRGGNSDDGLMQRFQLLVWPDIPDEWIDIDRYHDQQAIDDVVTTFNYLRDLKPSDVNAIQDLSGGPAYLKFDDQAQVRFNAARKGFEQLTRSGSLHSALESHFSKYPRMIAALALVIHLIDGSTDPVGIEATDKAIGWAMYLAKHAKRAYGAGNNFEALATMALSEKIAKGKLESGFTERELERKGWQYLSSKSDVTAALDWLIDAGWIILEDKPTKGRPTKLYIINPKVRG